MNRRNRRAGIARASSGADWPPGVAIRTHYATYGAPLASTGRNPL